MLLLAVSAVRILPEEKRGYSGWILLACLYGSQVVSANPKVAEPSLHPLLALVTGFTSQTSTAGQCLSIGWPVWSVAGGLLSRFPGNRGRYDKFPFEDAVNRARYYPLELLFITAFVTIPRAGPERTLVIPE
eukprot:4353887-Amphidinium_carterae.1